MIHFLPLPSESQALPEHKELLSRVAGLQRALRLVDPFGGGPASDFDGGDMHPALAGAGEAVVACFDRRSERVVGAAAAGLEAVAGQASHGRQASGTSLELLASEIRDGLADLSSLLRR